MENQTELTQQNWDSNEWQGRSYYQVQENYKSGFISLIGLLISLLVLSLL